MEFLHNALKLRREITLLLLKDFGVKNKVWDIKLLEKKYQMKEPDQTEFETLLSDYGIEDSVIAEYPQWLLDKFRNNLYDSLNELMQNITKANSIYPTIENECNERRIYQDRAISNCFIILEEMQFAVDILPVDCQSYVTYIELINKEIQLLKGWRKHTNKILKQIQEKG